MTAPRIAAESVRLHENNTPKDERFYSAVQRSRGVYNHNVTSEQMVTSNLRDLKSDLHSNGSQVYISDYEGCNTRNPMRTMHLVDTEVYRRHIAATISGMRNQGWKQQTTAAQCEKRRGGLRDLGV